MVDALHRGDRHRDRGAAARLHDQPAGVVGAAVDVEIEAEKLEAARLENVKRRLEVQKLRAEINDGGGALEDALTLAKIEKMRAETAAKVADL